MSDDCPNRAPGRSNGAIPLAFGEMLLEVHVLGRDKESHLLLQILRILPEFPLLREWGIW